LNSLPQPAEKCLVLTDTLTRSPSFLEKTRKFVSKESQKIVQPVIIKETLSTVSTKLSNTWSQMKSKVKRLYSNDFNYETTSSIRSIPLSNEDSNLLNNSLKISNKLHEDNDDIVSETSESSAVISITSSLIDFQNDFAERKNEILEMVGLGFDDEFDGSSIPHIKRDCNFDFKLRYKIKDKNVGNSSTINLDSLKEVIYEYCKIIFIFKIFSSHKQSKRKSMK
jgi:hypothetical protein